MPKPSSIHWPCQRPLRRPPEAAEGPAFLAGFAPDVLTGVPPKAPRSWRGVLGGIRPRMYLPGSRRRSRRRPHVIGGA